MLTRAILALTIAACVGAGVARAAFPARSAPAPRFKVNDVLGRTLELDDLLRRGPVLLDFWATWCKPCLDAAPELERWHRAYGPRGFTVIGISVDGPRNYTRVRPLAARLGLTYPIVIDQDERLRHLYQVVAMPTTVLIDRDGSIASVRLGYRPGEGEELEQRIVTLLATGSGADSSARPDGRAAVDTAGAHGTR